MQTTYKAEKPVIELFCGRTKDGQIFYAYLAIVPAKVLRYHAYIAMRKPINLLEFGRVIECGFGDRPSVEVRLKMEALGAKPDVGMDLVEVRRFG